MLVEEGIGMADKLTKMDKQARARLELAVRAIRLDPNLRYLFRQVFVLLGVEDSLPVQETNYAMMQFGRHSAGQDLKALLMSFDITLYAELLLEDAQESLNNQDEGTYDEELDEPLE